jgi:hypothetical protein
VDAAFVGVRFVAAVFLGLAIVVVLSLRARSTHPAIRPERSGPERLGIPREKPTPSTEFAP